MTNISNIERVVMQRVHLIRALRFAISSSVLSMLILGLALWGIGREVWVARVFENAPTNFTDTVRFYLYALGHTRFIVQALVFLTFGSLAYTAREVVRALSYARPGRA